MAKPSHIAKIAREYEGTDGGKKTAWTDIGVAWSIKEGKGFRLKLHALPIGDEILLLPNEEKAEGGAA